jgi:hypothetical protein
VAAIMALKNARGDDLSQLQIRGVEYWEEDGEDVLPPYFPPPHSDMFTWNAHLLQPMLVYSSVFILAAYTRVAPKVFLMIYRTHSLSIL